MLSLPDIDTNRHTNRHTQTDRHTRGSIITAFHPELELGVGQLDVSSNTEIKSRVTEVSPADTVFSLQSGSQAASAGPIGRQQEEEEDEGEEELLPDVKEAAPVNV